MSQEQDRGTWNDVYVGEWLSAADLYGREVTVEIVSAVEEVLDNGKKKQLRTVLGFAGKDKRLVLNHTNARAMAAMFGPVRAACVGKRVTLCVETVSAPDGPGPAIRVAGSPDITAPIQIRDPGHGGKRRTLRPTGRREEVQS